jgi:carboxyl-terminal processing protease
MSKARRRSAATSRLAEGSEESGSQSYVPPDEKDDRALKEALDLLRAAITDAAFPPYPKDAVR